jgi:hypothetical protein
MSRRNKHHRHDNDRSDYSDDEYDDDGEYEDGGNNTRGRDRTENDVLRARCHELEGIVNLCVRNSGRRNPFFGKQNVR